MLQLCDLCHEPTHGVHLTKAGWCLDCDRAHRAGRVEGIAQGRKEATAEIVAWLRRGCQPEGAPGIRLENTGPMLANEIERGEHVKTDGER